MVSGGSWTWIFPGDFSTIVANTVKESQGDLEASLTKLGEIFPTLKHPNLMPQWLKNRQERSKSKTPQRPSQPTYSPIEDETSNNPEKRKVNLFTTLALGLGAKVNGQEVETIIESSPSISVVSNSLVHPTHIKKETALPVQVATGEILFSLGTTQFEVKLGGKSIYHTALVLPTNAFQAVLGLDFLCTPPPVKVCQPVQNHVVYYMITKSTPLRRFGLTRRLTSSEKLFTNFGSRKVTHCTPWSKIMHWNHLE